ncbi:hypothetical protein VTK26DRAFT_8203 [Humicola hyalothermophila]
MPSQRKMKQIPFPELNDILLNYDYVCAKPQHNIIDCIKEVYRSSRGPELGTGGLVQSYTSAAIVLVHTFIVRTLMEVCPDERTRTELWDTLLLKKLQGAYKKTIDHANFLLDVERNSMPVTLNNSFSDRLDQARAATRYQARIKKTATPLQHGGARGWWLTCAGTCTTSCGATYDVSRKRLRRPSSASTSSNYHFLLHSEGRPLRLFDTKLVLGLSDEKLDAIAGEDATAVVERERLGQEVRSLKAAVNILRS